MTVCYLSALYPKIGDKGILFEGVFKEIDAALPVFRFYFVLLYRGVRGRVTLVGIGDGSMGVLRLRAFSQGQRGFTLPEVLTVIAILGILIAIAVIILLGILERRRVDAAANQLAADLRLANTNATNQLTDWRVVLVPNRAGENEGPDYYLVKLAKPYKEGDSKPTVSPDTDPIPRTFPANVKIMTQENAAKKPIQDDPKDKYYLSPDKSIDVPTRTLEFNPDGAMTGYGSPSGTIRVTIDGDPLREVRYLSATSRIRILS